MRTGKTMHEADINYEEPIMEVTGIHSNEK